MRVGVISNNDLCLPLLFYLTKSKAEVGLFLGKSSTPEIKRDEVPRFCHNYAVPFSDEAANSESVYQWMQQFNPDLVFVIGHTRKIDLQKSTLKSGIFNIHFGKLPQYRGPSPVFWQLKNMEPNIGCCIHELTEPMDTGPIYWEKEIKNEDHFSYSYVQYLFSNLIVEGVNDIIFNMSNQTARGRIQDESKFSWFDRPTLLDVLVKWDTMPAAEICALVRACNNWNNGAITLYEGMELKIIDASFKASMHPGKSPGTVTEVSDCIKISCSDNNELLIHYLSLNAIPFPGRQGNKFGIVEGEKLTYPSD